MEKSHLNLSLIALLLAFALVLIPAAPAASDNPLTSLQLQIDSLKNTLSDIEDRLDAAERGNMELQKKIASLEATLDSLSTQLEEIKGIVKKVK